MIFPRLNRRLTLESPTRQSDGAGGYVVSWTALGELWAEVVPRTGRETQTAGTPVAAVSYKIIVRGARVGDTRRPVPEQRFREGSRIFQIRAVTEHDRNAHYLVCFADEEVAV